MTKHFYVCSYGGCGSKMLCNALKKYGVVEHIHSRCPPTNLTYTGFKYGGTAYVEWFNEIEVPQDQLNNCYVIYIYRNPVKAIFSLTSRFSMHDHLHHIQMRQDITLNDVLEQEADLYGLKEFYENYTHPQNNRNYKIISVKYDDIFDNQHQLSKLLDIGPLNLTKRESNRKYDEKTNIILNKIYKDLIETMDKNDPIIIGGT